MELKPWMKKIVSSFEKLYGKNIDELLEGRTPEEIKEMIEETGRATSTKEKYAYSIAGYISDKVGEVEHVKYLVDYSFDLKNGRQAKEMDNEQDEKETENYLSQSELIKLRESYKDSEDQDTYLILCMITMQPVLRTHVYTTLKIAKTEKEVKKIENAKSTEDNYIYVSNKDSFIYINYDKVSSSKEFKAKPSLGENDPAYIKIENKDLVKIIQNSIKHEPREYLFDYPDIKNKQEKLLSALRKATKKVGKPLFDINMARSSYINAQDIYSPTSLFVRLSKAMRHSFLVQQMNYKKSALKDDEKDEILMKMRDQENEIIKLKMKLNEMEKYKSYWNDKRYDMIYSANKQGTKIKPANIKLFDIVLNENGKYE